MCPHCNSVLNVKPEIHITLDENRIKDIIDKLQSVQDKEQLVLDDPSYKILFIRLDDQPADV